MWREPSAFALPRGFNVVPLRERAAIARDRTPVKEVQIPREVSISSIPLVENLEERAAIARKRGIMCPSCKNVRTHAIIHNLRRVPLTKRGLVYRGVCIQCNPDRVPETILQEHQDLLLRLQVTSTITEPGSTNTSTTTVTGEHQDALSKDSFSLIDELKSLELKTNTTPENPTDEIKAADEIKSTALSWTICSGPSSALDQQSVASDAKSAITWDEYTSHDPSLWAISYEQLLAVQKEAMELFGEQFSEVTMRDINQEIIEPICRETGASFALHKNPAGLKADAFITHCWDGNFGDFILSIKKVFQTFVNKPNLWICAFALVQGNSELIKDQVGTNDQCIDNSPFVMALKTAKKFVVVRNNTKDIYTRIWCVCELFFANQFGLIPDNTFVTGPDCFSDLTSSCIDAEASKIEDKVKILKVLFTKDDQYKEIDAFVNQFRTQSCPT